MEEGSGGEERGKGEEWGICKELGRVEEHVKGEDGQGGMERKR